MLNRSHKYRSLLNRTISPRGSLILKTSKSPGRSMTNRLSTGVFIGHCPLRNVNYDVVSVCEMKTIFRNRSDPTAYSSAPGHTGKIRRPKIKGLSVIPSTRTFSRINPKSATSDSVSRLRTVCRPERKGDNAQ